MKELGAAKFILGMEINHDINAGALMIRQTRYIDDVVKRFNQQNAKMVETYALRTSSCRNCCRQLRKRDNLK